MALLKKINDHWQPSENPGLRIGDTLEVTDYQSLVRSGMAILVDSTGNELELPGQSFNCPICFKVVVGLEGFHSHVASHLQKNKENMEAVIKKTAETPAQVTTPEELKASVVAEVEKQNADKKAEDSKAKRIAALAKAREAKKAKIKEL